MGPACHCLKRTTLLISSISLPTMCAPTSLSLSHTVLLSRTPVPAPPRPSPSEHRRSPSPAQGEPLPTTSSSLSPRPWPVTPTHRWRVACKRAARPPPLMPPSRRGPPGALPWPSRRDARCAACPPAASAWRGPCAARPRHGAVPMRHGPDPARPHAHGLLARRGARSARPARRAFGRHGPQPWCPWRAALRARSARRGA